MTHISKSIASSDSRQIPLSESKFGVNFIAVLLFLSLCWLIARFLPSDIHKLGYCWALAVTAGFLAINDFVYEKAHRRPATGLTVLGPVDPQRLLIKLTGLYGTFFIVLLYYRIMPFYWESSRAVEFYGYFFDVIRQTSPMILALSVFYFYYMDRRQEKPFDCYWHMGCFLLGQWKSVRWGYIREHGRVWFIKAFFSPIMFGIWMEYLNAIFKFDMSQCGSFGVFHDHLLNICYVIDVTFGVLGYLLTFRINDTHIRSTEPTFLGWVTCLACYYPFYAWMGIGRLSEFGPMTWEQWLGSNPLIYYLCGWTIIVLSAFYALASVSFGYRLSNLTYRGLITQGPYRLTKHPAYVCKVASWWLISLPFLSTAGFLTAFHQTLGMISITFIYYLRAKTEENHLANYPEYVRYAHWIDEHGLFRWFKKHVFFLRFNEQNIRSWNSIVWFKKLK